MKHYMKRPRLGDGLNTPRHGTGKLIGVEIPLPDGTCRIVKGDEANQVIWYFHRDAIEERNIDVCWPRYILDLHKKDSLGRTTLSFSNIEIIKSNLGKFDFEPSEETIAFNAGTNIYSKGKSILSGIPLDTVVPAKKSDIADKIYTKIFSSVFQFGIKAKDSKLIKIIQAKVKSKK